MNATEAIAIEAYLRRDNDTRQAELVSCLARQGTWNIAGGHVYLPQQYVDEHYDLQASDADDLYDGVYGVKDLSAGIQKYAYMVATAATLAAVLMYITATSAQVERDEETKAAASRTNNMRIDPNAAYTGDDLSHRSSMNSPMTYEPPRDSQSGADSSRLVL